MSDEQNKNVKESCFIKGFREVYTFYEGNDPNHQPLPDGKYSGLWLLEVIFALSGK